MKFMIVALLVSFSAFANDIIKVTDGSIALCKTKVDVLRYQTSAIYRPLSFVRGDDSATLTVEFLRCVQSGEEFKFVRDTSLESRVVKIAAGPFSREDMTMKIERSEVAGVTFSSGGRVYNRNEMKKNWNNTYTQKMPLDRDSFEVDRNGNRFFEMAVSYKVKVINAVTGVIIDSKLEHLGSYRVYVK